MNYNLQKKKDYHYGLNLIKKLEYMKTPKEKAEEIIKNHLIAISEETMDSDNIILYTAKECAKVTVNYLKLNCPANMVIFWQEVKDEI